MIVLETGPMIELLTDGRDLRQVVATRLLAEEAAGEQLYAPALIDADGVPHPCGSCGMPRRGQSAGGFEKEQLNEYAVSMSESAERCAVAHPYGQLQLDLPGVRSLTVEEELEYRLKQLDDAGAAETDEAFELTLQLWDIRTLSERTARVREIIKVQAMYDAQGSWLIPGGVEVQWLCEDAVRAYIACLPLATLLCCHAACERVLAGCLESSQLRYGELSKNWERWGLGPLNAEALRRRIVSKELNADLNKINDNRRATAHFKHPLEPTAIWNRLFANHARSDGTAPADELRTLMDDDALEAYRVTMRLLRAPGEGFNSFESLLP